MLALRSNDRALTRWSDDFDRLFGRFVRGLDAFPEVAKFAPALDVREHDEKYEVLVELPGVDMKDIDITVDGNTLMVTGQKQESKEHKDQRYCYNERSYGSFRRVLSLPENVKEEDIKAQICKGVLSITLPKSQKATPRKITVSETN